MWKPTILSSCVPRNQDLVSLGCLEAWSSRTVGARGEKCLSKDRGDLNSGLALKHPKQQAAFSPVSPVSGALTHRAESPRAGRMGSWRPAQDHCRGWERRPQSCAGHNFHCHTARSHRWSPSPNTRPPPGSHLTETPLQEESPREGHQLGHGHPILVGKIEVPHKPELD